MRASYVLPALLLASPAAAVEVAVLGGHQYNADFEIAAEAPDAALDGLPGSPGDEIELDGGAAFGLAIDFDWGVDSTKRAGVFLSRSEGSFGDNAGLAEPDMDVTHLHFTGLSYYPQGPWEHFVTAGAGATIFDPDDRTLDDDTRFSLHVGAGTQYRLAENLALRLEARWFGTFFNSGFAGFCAGGCVIAVKSDIYSQFQLNAGLQFRF
ncbi:MAG: outer membrane beta-barrel protein [Pseudomonadota bacterium]